MWMTKEGAVDLGVVLSVEITLVNPIQEICRANKRVNNCYSFDLDRADTYAL
ncbi:hypothetical protein KSX_24200 [Ktedonospora formicarum]|uniref:Uncharacterized protein n=1 Tax=Ktedonospora formicarum TaxID=2778364 RepID=A0A8J3I108_9CHLR|nr:hypothetical protein KSX_24200 [Ktedonospora formicarum]